VENRTWGPKNKREEKAVTTYDTSDTFRFVLSDRPLGAGEVLRSANIIYIYEHIHVYIYIYIYIYITAVGLTPGGSSTSHIYIQTVHIIQRKENNREKGKLGSERRIGKCGPCPSL
jgi:hypothetical protein